MHMKDDQCQTSGSPYWGPFLPNLGTCGKVQHGIKEHHHNSQEDPFIRPHQTTRLHQVMLINFLVRPPPCNSK